MTSAPPCQSPAASVLLYVACIVGVASAFGPGRTKPNIVFFLTDDQDQILGSSFPTTRGSTPMPKTEALMVDGGATATNFFIHTPICNPSRSELLSGRYFHNIKTSKSPLGIWAMHVDEDKVNAHTFAKDLKERGGYTVGVFGKYQNVVPKPVPAGFDAWMANGGGTYLKPAFACKNIKDITGIPDGNWKGGSDNYTTAVVGNVSIAWIKKVVKEDPHRPFFAYIAPKAAHEPFNPAPWYEGHWDPSWPEHEPRPPNWNCSHESRKNHPGTVADGPMISSEAAAVITDIYKNRWRTLMSVDDVISDVTATVDALGLSNSTYYFYTSDHGFQMGEFNIPMDKRHVYDWDTRIHLVARGPGIKGGMTWHHPATQVDLAPTFLGLAGLEAPPQFDGKSLVPFLVNPAADGARGVVLPSTLAHLERLGKAETYKSNWRDAVFIEYYFVNDNTKCMGSCPPIPPKQQYPLSDASCGDLTPSHNAECWANPEAKAGVCNTDCYTTESYQNNFIALRSMEGSAFGNTLYAEYQNGSQFAANIDFTKVDFVEYYNVTADPWQMANLFDNSNGKGKGKGIPDLHAKLHAWFNCAGSACP